MDLTAELIEVAREASTYVMLAPGSRQLKQLGRLEPNALSLNLDEASQALGRNVGAPHDVFQSLVELCQADHLIMMTGNGVHDTLIHDVLRGRRWKLPPVFLATIPDRCAPANCLGTGDVMAGIVTFAIGQEDERPVGEQLFRIVSFAHEVTLLHLTESKSQRRKVQETYGRLRRPTAQAAPV
jgi:fructose-1-phosphate kinase PfkB-like protein